MYNIYRATEQGVPVTDKLVTVTGAVQHPITVRVPIGTAVEDLVTMAGGATI
ncbi:MAG: SLBB domain-containing protein, partial [Ruthenibacterium sp.]